MTTIALRCTLGELPVLGGYLRAPVRGEWFATLELHSEQAAPPEGSPAEIVIVAEGIAGEPAPAPRVFVGSITRAGIFRGAAELVVSVTGGAGHLEDELDPAEHVSGATPVPLGLIVRSVVDAAGEQLAPGVEAALDAFTVPRWHRIGTLSARDTLGLLAALVGASADVELGWRTLADGSIWMGVESWPAGGSAPEIAPDLDDGRVTYAPDGAPLLPGTTIGGHRAVEVFYTLIPPALRAHVRHRVRGDRAADLPLDLYRASYLATVVRQAANGSLDLRCEDDRLGDLRAVPFRLGIPGATATIPEGASVRLRFESADPRAPYACDFDVDAAATKPLALVGDSCGYLTASAPPGGGPCTLAISDVEIPGSVSITVRGPGHKYARGVPGT